MNPHDPPKPARDVLGVVREAPTPLRPAPTLDATCARCGAALSTTRVASELRVAPCDCTRPRAA